MLPLSRIVAALMAGVLVFALLVPMALGTHRPALAIGLSAVYAGYLLANLYLWRRMKQRS